MKVPAVALACLASVAMPSCAGRPRSSPRSPEQRPGARGANWQRAACEGDARQVARSARVGIQARAEA
eukprot:5050903-Alexandrium_andersonii.AAC.1